MAIEITTLGGGCFWCLDGAFRRVKGVESVQCGYAGGTTKNPAYEQVCAGETGHAEVVQITFDNGVISFRTLLELFFSIHDPTTLNRQGADHGTQYRSIILYHSDIQKSESVNMIKDLDASGVWVDSIVTQVDQLELFYEAEAYHQDYFTQNSGNKYCQIVISPKLKKFLEKHRALVR